MKEIRMDPKYDLLHFEPSDDELNNLKLYNSGSETYYVPRVTKLLDTIKDDNGLLVWANSLGFKGQNYEETLQSYADLGSAVHGEIEEYIRFGTQGYTPGFISFFDWWTKLNNLNTVTDVMSEVELIGPYFGGTTDLFCKLNGFGCLVDFKTSNFIGYKYIIQLAAYRYLMKICMNIDIRYCIILQLDKIEPNQYRVYVYDLDNPDYKFIFDMALSYIHNIAICYLQNRYLRYEAKAHLLTKRKNSIMGKNWEGKINDT